MNTLEGKATWFECTEENCIRATGAVSLKVDAAADPQPVPAVRAVFDAIRAQQPATSDAWKIDTLLSAETATITLTVLAIVGILQFLVQIRTILLWVLIGVILAVALQPAVGWLVRHRWNRILASLLVSFATVAVLVAVVVAVAWPVVLQSGNFIQAMPRLVDNVFHSGGALNFLEVKFHVLERLSSITPGQVTRLLSAIL